mmetsp:Transcript_6924/g.21058  ORF Transcript_6924/g.21058 Transcript_6924/m.21058 type:complete len:586 (+) Transcript_6924:294-2051(+)
MLISDYMKKKDDTKQNGPAKIESKLVEETPNDEMKIIPAALQELRSLDTIFTVEQFLIAFSKPLGLGVGGIDLLAFEDYLSQPNKFAFNREVLDDVMYALLSPIPKKNRQDWMKPLRRRIDENRGYFDKLVFAGQRSKEKSAVEEKDFNELPVRAKSAILKGLCDLAADFHEKVREVIKQHIKDHTMEEGLVRLKPCWRSQHGRLFYLLNNGSPSCTCCRVFSIPKKRDGSARVECTTVYEFQELLARTERGVDKLAAIPARRIREAKFEPILARVEAAERRREKDRRKEAMRLEAIARWESSGRPRRSATKVTSYAENDLSTIYLRSSDGSEDNGGRKKRRVIDDSVGSVESEASDAQVEASESEASSRGEVESAEDSVVDVDAKRDAQEDDDSSISDPLAEAMNSETERRGEHRYLRGSSRSRRRRATVEPCKGRNMQPRSTQTKAMTSSPLSTPVSELLTSDVGSDDASYSVYSQSDSEESEVSSDEELAVNEDDVSSGDSGSEASTSASRKRARRDRSDVPRCTRPLSRRHKCSREKPRQGCGPGTMAAAGGAIAQPGAAPSLPRAPTISLGQFRYVRKRI